jgi:hypothetical protein
LTYEFLSWLRTLGGSERAGTVIWRYTLAWAILLHLPGQVHGLVRQRRARSLNRRRTKKLVQQAGYRFWA